jgi:hypothetical protein
MTGSWRLPGGVPNPPTRVLLHPSRGQGMQPPRQPIAAGDDAFGHGRLRFCPQVAPDDERGIGRAERRQLQPARVACPGLHLMQPCAHVCRVVGGNDKNPQPRRGLGRLREQVDDARTRSVHIIENNQNRPPARRPDQACWTGPPDLRLAVLTVIVDDSAARVRVVREFRGQLRAATPGRAGHEHHGALSLSASPKSRAAMSSAPAAAASRAVATRSANCNASTWPRPAESA